MKIYLQKHITLNDNHPELPEWLFHNNDTILNQTISMDEEHLKEFLLFLKHYALDFDQSRLNISVVEFSELIVEYK